MDLATHSASISALLAMGALMLLQILVNDVAGIVRRKIPGVSVTESHHDFLFRSSRVVANTNDVGVAFLMLVVSCMAASTNPAFVAMAAWSFVVARLTYMVCYYANWQTMRSISFGLSLIALFGLLFIAIWF